MTTLNTKKVKNFMDNDKRYQKMMRQVVNMAEIAYIETKTENEGRLEGLTYSYNDASSEIFDFFAATIRAHRAGYEQATKALVNMIDNPSSLASALRTAILKIED